MNEPVVNLKPAEAKPTADIPFARHRGADELPFVAFDKGVDMQVLQIDIEHGLWVVRQRMTPGTTLPKHLHTGVVHAFTLSGSWRYLEYPEVNTAGSYLFEPAGSLHTLYVPDTNTEITDVWFAIYGANLNLGADGKVASILDASVVMKVYLSRCLKMGLPKPNVIGCEAQADAYWKAKGGA
jgi:quercetin dioxygenase-like cupin family protein